MLPYMIVQIIYRSACLQEHILLQENIKCATVRCAPVNLNLFLDLL